jgi:vancomycin resistance protein VanJ
MLEHLRQLLRLPGNWANMLLRNPSVSTLNSSPPPAVAAPRPLMAWAWLIALILLALALRYIGEDNPATAALLYIPPSVWLLPVVPIGLLALFRRSLATLLIIIIGCAFTGIALFGYRIPWPAAASIAPTVNSLHVTVMTHNIGQSAHASLSAFRAAQQPDFILLQDAPARAYRFRSTPGYEAYPFADDAGEYTLVSRHPILAKQLIPRPATPITYMMKYPLAARFEVEVKGQRIAIYNVHAFSPRIIIGGIGTLRSLFYGILGLPGTRWAKSRLELQAFWDAQQAGAQALSDQIKADPLPTIIAGDFNAPPLGLIHHRYTQHLQDAHAEVGSGSGYTFPGATNNPLSLFGPWLRLDKILASSHWRVIASEVEPHNRSQHRAVAATLALP